MKDEKKLCALNGAAQIYPFIKNKFFEQNVLMPSPTFGEYEKIFKSKTYYNDNGTFNFKRIKQEIENADIIVFVNPNNPTGTFVKSENIYDLIKEYPNKFFLVDESFIDFASSISVSDVEGSDLCTNFLIIKSMSKSHGFPGVRLGYVYSNNINLIDEIKRSLPVWNFNSIAEYFLEIMLKYRNEFQISLDKTCQDRGSFIKTMKLQNWVVKVFDSSADFILVETKNDILPLVDKLLDEKSIYIRDISSKFNDEKTYFRFAVRTTSENNAMIEAINSHLKHIK